MTTPTAKRIADRYIGRDGGEPASEPKSSPKMRAGSAWLLYAEEVHSVLRRPEFKRALWAFQSIGDAIAEDEKRARR